MHRAVRHLPNSDQQRISHISHSTPRQTDVSVASLNRRQLSQRARRLHEREERFLSRVSEGSEDNFVLIDESVHPPLTPPPTPAQLSQRLRRQRECQQRETIGVDASTEAPTTGVTGNSTRMRQRRTRVSGPTHHALAMRDLNDVAQVPVARRPYVEASITPATFGAMNILCSHCNALHWLAERTSSSVTRPEFGVCCHHGQVQLDPLPPPPELANLLMNTGLQGQEFREHIRQYNAALSFMSFNVNEQHIASGRGFWVFKMGYQLYHASVSLLPLDEQRPHYAQLFFYDSEEALGHRMHRNPNLRSDNMKLLQVMI
ncbi:hypothetical protein BC629DRAFT_919456 [Irpex lacteus]|nr:hypothetical protein BC629DRAFT_919456 [Irpex lacteus]